MGFSPEKFNEFNEKINSHSSLNAVIRTRISAAKKESESRKGILSGKSFLIKDNISIQGEPLTCGSRVLDGYVAPYHATVINRIIQEGGAIIGQTNMDEFAMGSSNEHSAYGPVKNPFDLERVPGGSSGGSAAAIAAGIADIGLGSDTGGSIRQPAGFCGLYGLKPTFGRVSRYGLAAFGSSFDQIGPLATTISDIIKVFTVISGSDEQDNTSSKKSVPTQKECMNSPLPKSIGIPRSWLMDGVDLEILEKIKIIESYCESIGIIVKNIELPYSEVSIPCYYILTMAEASSNLARYDGIHYGTRKNADSVQNIIQESRESGFGEEVKRRLMLGNYILSAGYYDQYYTKAQKVRRLIQEGFFTVFNSVDLILSPVTPTTAFKIGEKSTNPIDMYLSDIFTIPMSLSGVPSLAIPAGQDSNSLPIGLQITGKYFQEETILSFARRLDMERIFD